VEYVDLIIELFKKSGVLPDETVQLFLAEFFHVRESYVRHEVHSDAEWLIDPDTCIIGECTDNANTTIHVYDADENIDDESPAIGVLCNKHYETYTRTVLALGIAANSLPSMELPADFIFTSPING